MEWSDKGWSYEIACYNNSLTVLGREIMGTGELLTLTFEKPIFQF